MTSKENKKNIFICIIYSAFDTFETKGCKIGDLVGPSKLLKMFKKLSCNYNKFKAYIK